MKDGFGWVGSLKQASMEKWVREGGKQALKEKEKIYFVFFFMRFLCYFISNLSYLSY